MEKEAFQLCDEVDGEGMRHLMTTIGDKWSIYLIVALAKAPNQRARFSELKKDHPWHFTKNVKFFSQKT